jgi:putative MATE family efflux protein
MTSFNKDFRRALITLVIPIALQNLISAAVGAVDIIMLGVISQSVMSAVSLANQITFVIMLFYTGISIGAGILVSQYWGKDNRVVIGRVLNIACGFAVVISLVFFIVSISFPMALMSIFTNDTELIMYGARYQQVIAFSYLFHGLAQVYLAVARSMERVRFSALVSSGGLVLNIILNALCIFVLFPGNSYAAVLGVAVSTIIVRFIELACCVIYSLLGDNIKFSFLHRDSKQKQLIKDFIRYASPVLANYVVWGSALALTNAFIGHISSDAVAANAIANVIRNLAIVLCVGIAGGGSVLIGKYLGSGDIESGKKAGIQIYIYALVFGIIAAVLVLMIRPLTLNLVDINPTALAYLDMMLIITAIRCIGKSLNSTIIGGVFCAGGDAKFAFWCDAIVMWGIIMPLGYLSAFVWQVSPIMLYIVLSLDELIKIPIAFIRFRQYQWLKNITREF